MVRWLEGWRVRWLEGWRVRGFRVGVKAYLIYSNQHISFLSSYKRNSLQPSNHPTIQPSNHLIIQPSNHPTIQPSNHPTIYQISPFWRNFAQRFLPCSVIRILLCCLPSGGKYTVL
ncbi:MAG: hypothetical protein EP344_00570 [Bacteroidetes bacterium]|nr:MAG: hypothetical protein EP344_00570 [Bacteroidota bacterium]